MVPTTAGIGAALLGFLAALAHSAPGYLNPRIARDALGWLPRLESTIQTVLLYTYLTRAAAFVLGVLAVFALGYRVGSDLDLPFDSRRFASVVAVGGVLGYLAGLAFFLLVGAATLEEMTSLDFALLLGRTAGVGVQFAVVGFAGAAFASLERDRFGDSGRTSDDGDAPGRSDH